MDEEGEEEIEEGNQDFWGIQTISILKLSKKRLRRARTNPVRRSAADFLKETAEKKEDVIEDTPVIDREEKIRKVHYHKSYRINRANQYSLPIHTYSIFNQ